MTNTQALSSLEINKIILLLNDFYILDYISKDKPESQIDLGLRYDLFDQKYYVDSFRDFEPHHKSLITFETAESFKEWLSQQNNNSLAKIAEANKDLTPLSLEIIRDCICKNDNRYSLAGPYLIWNSRGDSMYPVHPIVAAIERSDTELFKKSFAITTSDQRKQPMTLGYNEHSSLIHFCFKQKFKFGAEALLNADYPCCDHENQCHCLSIIAYQGLDSTPKENPYSDEINFLFLNRIKNESELMKMLGSFSPFEFRVFLKNFFKNYKFDSPQFIFNILKTDYESEARQIMNLNQELTAFQNINLNQIDDTGWSSFMIYIKDCELNDIVFNQMIQMNADILKQSPDGDSILDLVFQNTKTKPQFKKEFKKKLYKLGCRSNKPNTLLKIYRNYTSRD